MDDHRSDIRMRAATGGIAAAADDLARWATRAPDQPGWYRDPDDASRQRFWDGSTWSSPVPAGTAATVDSVPRLLAG